MNILQRGAGRVGAALGALLCLALTVGPAHAAAGPDRPTGSRTEPQLGVAGARLDAFVRGQLQRTGVPGLAYAVVSPEGVVHDGVFGVDGDGEPVTRDTGFLWGSVAKPATATLVLLLADAGDLELDAPLTSYLPGFRTADRRRSAEVTVRHLLEHTSGLPEGLGLVDRYDDGRHPAAVLPELAGVELESEPGAEFGYSSLNYLVLAALVEHVTGRPFAEVLTRRVLGPAGMDDAITTPRQATERLPRGHRYMFGRPVPMRTRYDAAGTGYGYLGGSLRDATAFARAQLAGSDLLTTGQRHRLHAPGVSTGPDRGYALGWRTWPVLDADGGEQTTMVWHSGAVAGYFASVVLLPELERAVVVLHNAYGYFQEPELLDTAWGLATLLAGRQPERHEPGPAYAVGLATLSFVCLLLLGLAVTSARRLARPRSRSGGRRAVVLACWLVPLALLGTALAAVPRLAGVRLTQVFLWAPDVAGLLSAGLALAGLLAVLRVAVALRGAAGIDDAPGPTAT